MGLVRAAARSFRSPAVVVLTQGDEHESGWDPEGKRVALLLLVDSTLLGWEDGKKERKKKKMTTFS